MKTYKISRCRFQELKPAQIQRWKEFHASTRDLASPYFHPSFTEAVSLVRADVYVGIIEREGEIVGFLPFQAGRRGVGKPVGGRLNDYHGVIGGDLAGLSPKELLSGCGLKSYEFDHVVETQQVFQSELVNPLPSHQLNLRNGYPAYAEEQRQRGSGAFKEAQQKLRKIERDLGPTRIELDCRDPEVFETLLQWKADQYKRTNFTNVFAFDWTVQLLKTLWNYTSPEFAGTLQAFWGQDRLLAVHFGMQAGSTMHWWFPAYDSDYYKHSPGSALMIEVARLAAEQGIDTIDLGKGDERFKSGFSSQVLMLGEGSLEASSLRKCMKSSWQRMRTWAKSTPLAAPVRRSAQWTRPLRERWTFQ